MPIVRSVLAVVAGIATFSILLLVAMAAGNAALGSEPEWINRSVTTQRAWLVVNTAGMIAGSCVTARLASSAPRKHAIVMAAIQSALTLVALQSSGAGETPLWLWWCGITLTIPVAWLGATIATGRSRSAQKI